MAASDQKEQSQRIRNLSFFELTQELDNISNKNPFSDADKEQNIPILEELWRRISLWEAAMIQSLSTLTDQQKQTYECKFALIAQILLPIIDRNNATDLRERVISVSNANGGQCLRSQPAIRRGARFGLLAYYSGILALISLGLLTATTSGWVVAAAVFFPLLTCYLIYKWHSADRQILPVFSCTAYPTTPYPQGMTQVQKEPYARWILREMPNEKNSHHTVWAMNDLIAGKGRGNEELFAEIHKWDDTEKLKKGAKNEVPDAKEEKAVSLSIANHAATDDPTAALLITVGPNSGNPIYTPSSSKPQTKPGDKTTPSITQSRSDENTPGQLSERH